MIFIFLSSGLFLGWSLGANDAANVFGSAVGSRMIKFRTAALICGLFVILGAFLSGSGAAATLGKLGSVNAIAGAFVVASAAAITVFIMTRLTLPVSTSQAIVGAIIGWNIFASKPTDMTSLTKIVATWVICPVLSAVFAIGLYFLFRKFYQNSGLHLLTQDAFTRGGLLVAGAFGSYALGANNIANVMGVFVPVSPFQDIIVFQLIPVSGGQQLFLIGGVAIAVGVFTYSRKVMETVGGSLFKLTPETALVVVLASSMVLFVFASSEIEALLNSVGFPSFPLVPVSSSQAIVGAILGIGIVKGGQGIKFGLLGKIALGWILTPLGAGIISLVSLFFMQNVFGQVVFV